MYILRKWTAKGVNLKARKNWNTINQLKISHYHTLIEMSWTRTRGACIQINQNSTNILSETKLLLIVHVSVYKFKINKMTCLFPSSITLIFRQSFDLSSLQTILATHTRPTRIKHNADSKKVSHKTKGYWKARKLQQIIAFVTCCLSKLPVDQISKRHFEYGIV